MHLRIAAGLAVMTLFVFGSVITHDFINLDTPAYIQLNPNVSTGVSIANIHWAFTTFHMANWHPLTWLSHMLDVEMFGMNPAGHHAVNLLWHTLNVVLLFLFLNTTTGLRWPAAFVAAAFAIHPAHIESVAWVAERKDVLSTFFLLTTLISYHHYTKAPSTLRNALVVFLFGLGLMAKPMLVTLPFVLLLFDYWPLNRIDLRTGGWSSVLRQVCARLYEKLPLFLLALVSIAITLRAQEGGRAMDPGASLDLVQRAGHAVVAYGHYLQKALLPGELALYYPHPGQWPLAIILLNLGLLALISLASVVWIRRFPWFFVGWALFLGTLVPVIGIVQIGAQAWADRYTYIPYIGLFIMLAFGVREVSIRLSVNRALIRYGAATLLLLYAVVSIQYLGHWKNSTSIWTHSLLVTDQRYAFLMGVATSPPERSERLRGLYKPWFLLGKLKAEAGFHADALVHLNEALSLKPGSAEAHYFKAHSLLALGRRADALAAFDRVIELDPDNDVAREEVRSIRRRLAR